MKNKELFDKTVNILVQAYLNDTLDACKCQSCAVGNIIAFNIGVNPNDNRWYPNWFAIVWPISKPFDGWDDADYEDERVVGLSEVTASGYSASQLADIENAFMDADYDYGHGRGYFTKLKAVVDVLCQIHEANEETKKEAKALFVK